jgi:CheY-like chemotaxis protein
MRQINISCLKGLRMAVVEDEALIAMTVEDALLDAGAQVVGSAGTVAQAIALVERERPDAVTLDGNLRGELSGPVAARLDELGIRYLVVTGYVELTLQDPHLSKAPRLAKPFTADSLVRAAAEHLC